MKKESVKKSLEKSKIILEEKRKNVHAKILHKKHTFTIINSHSRAANQNDYVCEHFHTKLKNTKTAK